MSGEPTGERPEAPFRGTGHTGWRWVQQPFAVLIYHEVSSGAGSWCVPGDRLEEHLAFLAASGCSFVSTTAVWKSLTGSEPLPPRAVCIHFDDARAGVLTGGLPVLRRQGAPATVYVVSGWAGRSVAVPEDEAYSGFLDWDEVGELDRDPLVEIGSHGVSHRNLKRAAAGELTREVEESRQVIADKLGADVYHFASPYNRTNGSVRRAVIGAGYRTLSGGGGRVNRWLGSPHRLKRFLVTNGTTTRHLARIVESL